ncbi:MAG: restriction endonuclease [Cyanobium sp. 49614_E6]|jgi:hypothetical protein|nr:restriction endonuclease [Cyanobium sp. 49614_E6]
MDWREYQNQTAELFRSIGCSAYIEKSVLGVRGQHAVDVLVTRTIYGLEHRWVIETKHWRKRVSKLHVIALKGIVEDVGADRGILLSSSGFQGGAISMAERSNITLSSLDALRVSVQEELERYTLSSLEKKAAVIANRLADRRHHLYAGESRPTDDYLGGNSCPNPAINYRAFGKLSVLDLGFRSVRIGKIPIPIGFKEDENTITSTRDIGRFLEEASKIIADMEHEQQEQFAKMQLNS